MTAKSLLQFICLLLCIFQLCLLSGLAADLDLSSAGRTHTASQSGSINVGGSTMTVAPGTLITAGESVALSQVLGGGTQNLVLDAAGVASGGQFTLTGSNQGSVTIPTGVTAVHNFAGGLGLNLTGTLTNMGSFYAVSNSVQTMTAVINAQNINNLQGGLLTTVLPSGGLSGFSGLVNKLSLTLNAVQDIVNQGSISSAANLNLIAGGSIINVGASGGAAPLVTAVTDLNMVSGYIQNAGMISSLTSNINISTPAAQNLVINNSGIIEALGNINIRDELFTPKFNTSLLGGDWLSQQLNVFSGDGHINVDVNQISGQVNLIGGTAALASKTGDLHVGALKMSGDPTISSGGDVFLEKSQFGGNEWLFPGLDALIITAGGNIINVDVTKIGTANGSGLTGSVIMTAGGMIDLQTNAILSISTSTSNANSGNITLSAQGPILLSGTLSTHSTNGNSGSVSIDSATGHISTAGNFSIDTSSSGFNGGAVSLTSANGVYAQNGISINTSSNAGFSGDVNVVAQMGDIDLTGSAGKTNINTSNGSGTAGQVNIQAMGGNLLMGDGTFNLASSTGGGGGFTAFVNGGTLTAGKSLLDVSGKNGGSVSIVTTWMMADIDMSNVDIKANGATGGTSGSVSVMAGLFGQGMVFSDKVSIGSIEITGGDSTASSIALSTTLGDVSVGSINSNGGAVIVTSAANVQVGSVVSNNAGGTAGTVSVTSYAFAAPTDSTQNLVIGGGGPNSVGSVSLNGANGGTLFATNHGTGSVSAGNIVISATTGNGGTIGLVADSDVVLTGSSYSVNGGSNGTGGQVIFSGGNSVQGGNFNVSAVGGVDGGTLSVTGKTIQFGNMSSDTSAHGLGTSGSVGIGDTSTSVTAQSMNLTNNGGGTGVVQLTGSIHVDDLTVTAKSGDTAGKNGGAISLLFTDGVHGALNLDNSGSLDGTGGSLTINSLTDLNLQAGKANIVSRSGSQSGNGGFVYLFAGGSVSVDSSTINVAPQGVNGNGGSITVSTGLNSASPTSALTVNGTLNADGVGNGNGGTVNLTVNNTSTAQGNLTVGNGSGFNISARSGTSNGNGGSVIINVGGDLNVDGSGISVATRGVNGNGGTVNLAAGVSGGNHTLSTNGALLANGVGTGNGGTLTLTAQQVSVAAGSTLSASAAGAGKGGTVTVNAAGTNADLLLAANTSVLATSNAGAGGSIILNASRNLTVSGATLNSSSSAAAGGQLALNAGITEAGTLSLDGNLLANAGGSAAGGSISLSQNSALAMQIGKAGGLPGATVSASNANGSGGTLNLSSGAGNDLNVQLNQTVNLSGSSLANLGTINASSKSSVSVTGAGSLSGSFNGSGVNYTVTVDGAGSTVGVKNVSATGGDAIVKATAADGVLAFAAGSTLQASKGSVEMGAPAIHFLGDSTVSMDNAGLLKVNSGNQSSSLTMDFADGATVSFNVTQGTAVRPGVVQVGPNGAGSLTLAGNATVDFTGGTVSMNSASGSVDLGSGLSISSDAFDTTLNLGLEIIASNGDVNLNSAISARQLNVSTLGSGNINLASDISSPTVVLSVQGNSSINQVGAGSLGIGTLILSSQSGNIGSAANPIAANVFELQVNSGGSVYVDNESNVDLRTSVVAGTFQLNNEGDVAVESNLTAGNLNITANNGSISIFNPASGSSGVSLASTGTGNSIEIASGIQISSSTGSIDLSTSNLILNGSLAVQTAGAHVSIDSTGTLDLSGAGSISSSGSNGLINISGSDAVNFNSSYILNAGSTGTVQVQTASLSSAGVSLASGVNLNAAGGSQFNIFTNALSFGSGSSITGSNGANPLTVQSTAGAPLTVSIEGGSTATVNASAGGSVHFNAGAGGALSFMTSGAGGTANLNITGANLVTTSSAADTNLNNVNLASNQNITINVNGGTLNLNGNITSSQPGGVIVLQDPAGISINGSGTVGFASGLSGTIDVLAMALGDSITFLGDTNFNAGVGGTVNFKSLGSINFADGASPSVMNGATLNMSAPVISFGNNSGVTASGASSINLSSIDSSGLTVLLPDGGATLSTQGAQITISAETGAPLTFAQAGAGGTSTLNFAGAPVVISTSNANVTINENVVLHSDNNVSVFTPGGTLVNNGLIENPNPGSTTIIEAAGNLFINDNVSANSLIIRTTANNGNITLSANVNVVNDLLVSANGSGWIKQTAGVLTAGSIVLESGSGDIGTEDGGRIHVGTGDLSVSTKGAAWVKAEGPVTVSSYNVGGGLNLKANGDIIIGGADRASTSITSNGTFNAGPSGKVSLLAANLITLASGVKFRVKDSALDVSAANINMGNNSRLRSDGNLNVSGNVSGSDFKLVSREGNLQISGSLSGHNVLLRTKNDGNITLNGNVSANSLTVDADGTGDISSTGMITAASLDLNSDKGNIGSSSAALNVTAGELSANTGGKGVVNINATGDLSLGKSSSGGNFSLATSGNLTVQKGVETKSGSINLQANGLLRVEKNAKLEANQGNLTLQNNNTTSGVISIGKNASLVALSDSQSNGLGNIYVTIGEAPSSPVAGKAPSGLAVSTKWGGQAYFGANGITVNGKNNEVNAWGANVVFNTGSLSKSAIVLDGGVYMLADPPPAASVAAPIAAAPLAAPLANQVQTPNFAMPSVTAPSFVFNHNLDKEAMLNRQSGSQNDELATLAKGAPGDELTAVACVSSATDAAIQQGHVVEVVDLMQRAQLPSASVYTKACHYEAEASTVNFKKGEMLVNAHRFSHVRAGNADVCLSGNAVALFKSTGRDIEIFNICEDRWGAIKVEIADREFTLGAGQRLLIGQNGSVAVRNEKSEKVGSSTVKIAEFPLISLLQGSALMIDLVHSDQKVDRQVRSRMLKMAACLQMVTASHGAYKN